MKNQAKNVETLDLRPRHSNARIAPTQTVTRGEGGWAYVCCIQVLAWSSKNLYLYLPKHLDPPKKNPVFFGGVRPV